MSEGESRVMENLSRKAEAASRMFDALVAHMIHAVAVERPDRAINKEEIPTWL
jgi:hypothetical protein